MELSNEIKALIIRENDDFKARQYGELTKEELTDAIVKCGFEPTIRGEKLGVADFVTLSDEIFVRIKDKK